MHVLAINDPLEPDPYELLRLLHLYANAPELEVDHGSADDCVDPIALNGAGFACSALEPGVVRRIRRDKFSLPGSGRR